MNLHEVSRIAGVSATTVSNALSGKGRVAEATRRRIVKLADQLGFRPQAAGRALVTGRRDMVGFVSHPPLA